MNIAVHDFGCYSFPLQLARRMARDGHNVYYFCSDFYEIKGDLGKTVDDPPTLSIEVISISQKHEKYNFVKRALQEYKYAVELKRALRNIRPDYVLSCNAPVIVAWHICMWCQGEYAKYIHWMQDIHSIAIKTILQKKIPLFWWALASIFISIEKRVIARADSCIAISGDFLQELELMGAKPKKIVVIPNWMPLDEIYPVEKRNPWAKRNNLLETINIMYVGTLSLKHSPEPFIELAKNFKENQKVRIVVVSAGIVFDQIAALAKEQKLNNLILLGWQEYEELPMVLGTADILFASLTSYGSRFSIPCKILTYASAGRAVLAYMPKENLVSRIVGENNFGIPIDISDIAGLIRSANRMVNDDKARIQWGVNGRNYAVKHFDISKIALEFYKLME
jgi:colanic acid biosynthesis glycosyl transferase WcaI